MSDDQQPQESKIPDVQGQDEFISLEDIDALLAEDDEEFAQSMQQLKDIGTQAEVEIESVDIEGNENQNDTEIEVELSGYKAKLHKCKLFFIRKYHLAWKKFYDLLVQSKQFSRNAIVWSKTQPKEYLKYMNSQAKSQVNSLKTLLKNYWKLRWYYRIGWVVFVFLSFLSVIFIGLTFKGGWAPQFGYELIGNYSNVSDKKISYDPKNIIDLFAAFPQPEHTVLLGKIKANLRQYDGASQSMIFLQFYMSLDSKDTAIEVKEREKELLDIAQRAVETQTFRELRSRQGKARLKRLIKKDLSRHLNQGQIYHIYFNHFILKF